MTAPYRGSGYLDLSRERETAGFGAVAVAMALASCLSLVDLTVSVAEYAFVRTKHIGPPIAFRLAILAAAHVVYVVGSMLVLHRTIARRVRQRTFMSAASVVIVASLGATWQTSELARSMVTSIPEPKLTEWIGDLERYFTMAPLVRPAALGALLAYAALLWHRRSASMAPSVCPHCAAPLDDQSAENRSSMS